MLNKSQQVTAGNVDLCYEYFSLLAWGTVFAIVVKEKNISRLSIFCSTPKTFCDNRNRTDFWGALISLSVKESRNSLVYIHHINKMLIV